MKASPRMREATAYIRLRNQPAQVKYPLLAVHIIANPDVYNAGPLNVRKQVRIHYPNLNIGPSVPRSIPPSPPAPPYHSLAKREQVSGNV